MDGKQRNTNHTHIWIVVYSRDQVVNEGLQGPGRQVVVMVIESGVALLLGLVQVLVVAGVQLPRERWSLRHVVLHTHRERGQTWSGLLLRYLTADADAGRSDRARIALRHKHRRRRTFGHSKLPLSILRFLGLSLFGR